MAGRQAKYVTRAQLRVALKHARKGRYPLRDQVMILLSHKSGLRAQEIALLNWSMLLASDGTLANHIAIADRIAKRGSGRAVPIHPMLRTALLDLQQKYGSEGNVIKSERGAFLRPSSVVHWFKSLYSELGFDGCTSHSGRRTFITNAARQVAKTGGSIRDVQKLAGHSSVEQTMAYIDSDAHAQRRLVSLL